MPNRMLKESTFTSDKIASLSDFEFRLWVGLITYVDDAGRGDARPAVIRGRLFALRERVTIKDISDALHSLAAKGCVSLYTVGGKPYFWFPTWGKHQRIRDVKPKYPGPDDADESKESCNLPQTAASCGNLPQTAAINQTKPNQTETESEKRAREARPTSADCGFGPDLTSAFEDWLRYKREKHQDYKPTGLKALVTKVKNNAEKYGEAAVIDLIRECMAANWQGIIWDKLDKPKQGKTTAKDYQPTQDRIRKNNDWLDQFLEEQGGANT